MRSNLACFRTVCHVPVAKGSDLYPAIEDPKENQVGSPELLRQVH